MTESVTERVPWIVGVSGASGTPYARAVLNGLLAAGCAVDLIVSRAARLTLLDEVEVMAEVRAHMPAIIAGRERWEAIARQHEPHMKALYMHCMTQETGLNRLAAPPAPLTI